MLLKRNLIFRKSCAVCLKRGDLVLEVQALMLESLVVCLECDILLPQIQFTWNRLLKNPGGDDQFSFKKAVALSDWGNLCDECIIRRFEGVFFRFEADVAEIEDAGKIDRGGTWHISSCRETLDLAHLCGDGLVRRFHHISGWV